MAATGAPMEESSSSASKAASTTSSKKGSSWLSRSKSNAKASLQNIGRGGGSSSSSGGTTSVIGAASAKLTRVMSGDSANKPSDKGKGKEEAVAATIVEESGDESINKAVGPVKSDLPSPKAIVGAVKDDWPLYSCRKEDYTIGEPIGFGSSAIVHLAKYAPIDASAPGSTPDPILCAIKIVDVDRLSSVGDIDRLRRETQLMALSKHPNVLRVRGEWIEGSKLYIACRYMSPGSLLDISRFAFQDGFDEVVIATALKQTLEGLLYLHQNGWIHRDVKAANLLVDDDGTVLLADFGVSSSLFIESAPLADGQPGPRILTTRKSFVGTPCWMAPEVVERRSHDSKADIWSFGITALELACGRAPNSLYPPAKVLSKTILEESPTLDREGGKYKYSRTMKEMIDSCLVKDPRKRPSADKLLAHPFFKTAKRKGHLVGAILSDLPPLEQRQSRRRKPSASADDSIASWNFDPTVHGTLHGTPSLREPSDPFNGFTMSNSSSFVRRPTTAGSHASGATSPVLGGGGSSRRREASTASSGHRRGVSFDFVEGEMGARPPLSPRSANGFGEILAEGKPLVDEPKDEKTE